MPEDTSVLCIMNTEEFREKDFVHGGELSEGLSPIHCCKAERLGDCVYGTLRIPQKNESRQPQIAFGFYMTQKRLVLVGSREKLYAWLPRQQEEGTGKDAPERLLRRLMEQMIAKDVLFLSRLEKEMEHMEERLLYGVPEDFFAALSVYRRKLSELNVYYAQLAAMGDVLQTKEGGRREGEAAWERYTLRTERLQNQVHILQENVLQLRELFQSRQDAQQNRIMCILTIVTTLFLPLNLLTGWYGMNFRYMPELCWKYGYLAVSIAALTVIALEIFWFKKKKIF